MATVSPGPAGGGGGGEEEEVCEANNLEKRGDDNDDEEDPDHGSAQEEEDQRNKKDKKKKKNKKKKKMRLMTLSGQSDVHRRTLRQDFRQLKKDIATDVDAAEAREDNNLLWDDVRYTREAVLDSENMDLITSKAAREAEKIIQIPRYDAMAIARNLVKKGSTRNNGINQFNWQGLGFQVGVCFSALPSNCSFLYGPLDAEYTPKERKKVERKRKAEEEEEEDDLVEDQPEIMEKKKKNDRDGNELSAVERHIKVIKDTLRERTKEERGNAKGRVEEYLEQLTQEGDIDDEEELARKKKEFIEENSKVDAVKFLFNPNSFTQTVENISNFSFLVKEGIKRKRANPVEDEEWGVDIKARGAKEAEEFWVEPGPVAIARFLGLGRSVPKPPPKQAIVALSMKDWRDICAAYAVEKSDLPHREKESAAKNKAFSEGAEEGGLPQVSQDTNMPEAQATQNNTSSLDASVLPQVSQDLNIAEPTQNNTNSVDASDVDVPQVSQESYAPRREEKQAEKARRAFCL